ncbi:hypothetical protein KAR91_74355, partial [Candidatus Pacearchaeota archaeon]|nr:hypothetical protein [Candidatus Pacearchaeota archaeon]
MNQRVMTDMFSVPSILDAAEPAMVSENPIFAGDPGVPGEYSLNKKKKSQNRQKRKAGKAS